MLRFWKNGASIEVADIDRSNRNGSRTIEFATIEAGGIDRALFLLTIEAASFDVEAASFEIEASCFDFGRTELRSKSRTSIEATEMVRERLDLPRSKPPTSIEPYF